MGRVAHFALAAAHHAGERLRLVPIADQQVLRIEHALFAVQRRHPFAGPGGPHHDLGTCQAVEVEGVERMPKLEQDVIGHIDDIVDWPHSARTEPVGEPKWRWTDGYALDNPRAVPRTSDRVLNPNLDSI